jgi:dTDP-4-amino-4,6-dideoxygalactose transaminase
LPDRNGPKEIGVHFDAMILSFGRDKAISGISGGAVIVKNPATSSVLQNIEADAVLHTWWEVAKLLEYATRMHSIVRPLSFCGLQKPLIKMLNLLGLFVPVVTDDEKNGHMSPILHKIPNACASLALVSLKNLQSINDHRRALTKLYLDEGKKRNWPILSGITDDLPMQKFPLFVKNAKKIREELKKKNIHLDDGWTGCVICPESCDASAAGYENGDDPNAQMVGEQILSLPTHPTMTERQAKWLIQEMNHLLN